MTNATLREKTDAGSPLKNLMAIACCCVASFAAVSVAAGEVRILYGNVEANSMLYGEGESGAKSEWAALYTDGRNPHAGADYVLQGGLTGDKNYLGSGRSCLGSSGHTTFRGDSLRLGDVTAGQSFSLMQRSGGSSYAACLLTINSFILERGTYYLSAAGDPYCEVQGTIEVRSQFDAPFDIYIDNSLASLSHWRFAAPISGAAGTALKFYYDAAKRANAAGEIILSGDNSSYKGKFIVDNVNAWLCFANDQAMGENAALSDAVILRNGGGVGGAQGTSATVTSLRGITVEATGGTFYAGAGAFFRLAVPVVGTGAVRVSGGGTFYFNGDYQAGDITVAAGTSFQLGKDADLHGAKVTYEGGEDEEVWLPKAGVTNTFDLSTMTDPTIVFSHNDDLTSGTFDLTGVCATWPLRLKVADGFIRPATTEKFTILRIPTALKEVTAKDFYFANRLPQSQRHWIEIDGDYQVVRLEFPKVLMGRGDGFQWGGGSRPDYWTDGTVNYQYGQTADAQRGSELYDPTVAYLNTLATQQRVALPTPFCGADYLYSLSLSPSTRYNVNYGWKVNNERVFSDLRLYGNTYLYPNNGDMTIAGGLITIVADADQPAEVMGFSGSKNYRAVLKSDLTGDGVLRVGAEDKVTAIGSRIVLSGDNSRFLGTLVHDTRCTNALFTSILEIADDDALGGNLAKPTANAVQLSGTGNVLRVTADVTLDAPNRGITVGDGYVIEVPSGKTLTITSPLKLSGAVTKTGAGTLVLSPNVTTDGPAELVVREGRFLYTPGQLPASLTVTPAGGAALLSLPSAGAEANVPTDRDYDGFAFSFVAGAQTGCLVFSAESLPRTFPLAIDYTLATRPAASEKYAIFKILTAARTVTKWDFVSKGSDPCMEKYSVETVGDCQVVSVEFPEVMKAQDINFQIEKWTVDGKEGVIDIVAKSYPEWWTLADWPKYACLAKKIGVDTYRWNNYWGSVFPGDSLSVQGTGTGVNRYYICGKAATYDIDDLRFYDYMYYRRNSSSGTIKGHLLVAGSPESPSGLHFESTNGTLSVQSDLRGEGWLQVLAGYESTNGQTLNPRPGCALTFSGDNSRFLGTLEVKPVVWPTTADTQGDVTIKVSAANQLGGNPATLNPKATRILGANTLEATGDVVTTAENRGYYFADQPTVKVASGKTLSLASPVLVTGTLTKTGAGALRLSGVTAETPAAGANVLAVTAGAFELTKPWASSNVAFDVASAASTTLRLSRTAIGTQGLVNTVDDAPFGSSGAIALAWAEGEGLALQPRTMRQASIPLMTVKAAAAAAIAERIVLPTAAGAYQLRTETAGELATICVDAKLKSGLILTVR